MADTQAATIETDVVSGNVKADGRIVKGIPLGGPNSTTRTEPEAPHGSGPRGLMATPSSLSTAGRFGRMFRRLPVFSCNPDSMIVLGAAMVQQPEDGFIDKALGVDDDDENVSRLSNHELRLPAGYTYFGQFVDHDITFDPVSSLTRQNDPDSLTDFRTPKFDLDSLYGRGPADQPYMYDEKGVTLALGEELGPDGQRDLKRVQVGDRKRALIGDPRNDENKIVSQLQTIFIQFHNRVFQLVRDREKEFDNDDDRFKRAQQLVRWHYQWVVVHDFLRRIVGDDPFKPEDGVVAQILKPEKFLAADGEHGLTKPHLLYYDWIKRPFMPVEFSVAAYRFGHSAIRPSYHINSTLQNGPFAKPHVIPGTHNKVQANRIPIFTDTKEAKDSLGGFQEIPSEWGVDWNFFLDLGGQKPNLPQPSYKIDTSIANPLGLMPKRVADAEHLEAGFSSEVAKSLPVRNLVRGLRLGLPAGEHVARGMGLTPDPGITISADFLKGAEMPNNPELGIREDKIKAAVKDLIGDGKRTPLWYYILHEAQLQIGKDDKRKDVTGAHLGPVGGRIVAEVLIGLLYGDPFSFLNVEPNWTPTLPRRDGSEDGPYTLADLVKFAIGA